MVGRMVDEEEPQFEYMKWHFNQVYFQVETCRFNRFILKNHVN